MYSEAFKKLRNELNLTQLELSEKTGIPKRSIESWEEGARTPPEWIQRLILEELKRLQ